MNGETICQMIRTILAQDLPDVEKVKAIEEAMGQWDEYAHWDDDR